MLIPLPSDDDSLLGRVLMSAPEPGRSVEETARPNPCADKLLAAKTTPVEAEFEDSKDISAAAKAKAMLGVYGFAGDIDHASHFMYRISVHQRIARTDTTEYAQCCKDKGCGYGYVSALVYGEGEYATGEETTAAGSAGLWVASASGSSNVKVIHRRKVKGWIAAVVTVTDSAQAEQLGPLGVAVAAGITEASVPEQVKQLYEADKIRVENHGSTYFFVDGHDTRLTENEFLRRFHDSTGSSEIDDLNRRHNTGGVITWGIVAGVSAGLAGYGFTHLSNSMHCTEADRSECDATAGTPNATRDPRTPSSVTNPPYYDPTKTYSEPNPAGIAAAGFGVIGLGLSLPFLIPKLANPDGSPSAHYLTERDARLYAERHNRALLRKTVTDVQRVHSAQNNTNIAQPQPWVPLISVSSTGFMFGGSF